MNIYWVADNIRPHNELELFFLFCSVTFWKKNHPTHTLNIVTNSDNVGFYTDMNLWDNVMEYRFSTEYIKGEGNLWAIGKLDAMKSFKTPFCILDLDMFYTLPVNFSNNDVMFAHLEDGTDYYIDKFDKTVIDSGIKLFSNSKYAANVSFLYISNASFKDEYTNIALKWAYEFSKFPAVSGSHMVLCEQKLLMDLIERNDIKFGTLIDDVWKCTSFEFLNPNKFDVNFFHLWSDKKSTRVDFIHFIEYRSKIYKIIYDRYPDVTKEYTKFRKKIIL
jgi:hypothetical protein